MVLVGCSLCWCALLMIYASVPLQGKAQPSMRIRFVMCAFQRWKVIRYGFAPHYKVFTLEACGGIGADVLAFPIRSYECSSFWRMLYNAGLAQPEARAMSSRRKPTYGTLCDGLRVSKRRRCWKTEVGFMTSPITGATNHHGEDQEEPWVPATVDVSSVESD